MSDRSEPKENIFLTCFDHGGSVFVDDDEEEEEEAKCLLYHSWPSICFRFTFVKLCPFELTKSRALSTST